MFSSQNMFMAFKKKEKETNIFRYSHIIILPNYLNPLYFIFSDDFLVPMYNGNTVGIFYFPIYHKFASLAAVLAAFSATLTSSKLEWFYFRLCFLSSCTDVFLNWSVVYEHVI